MAWLAIFRFGKTVFRATAVACEPERAGEALRSQARHLAVAKFMLTFGPDHVAQRRFDHSAKVILRVYIMVARIQAAIMLQRQAAAAGFGKDAKR